MWEELVVVQFEVLFRDLPSGTKRNWKFSVKTDGHRAELWIWNVKTKRYLYNVHVKLHVLNSTNMATTRECGCTSNVEGRQITKLYKHYTDERKESWLPVPLQSRILFVIFVPFNLILARSQRKFATIRQLASHCLSSVCSHVTTTEPPNGLSYNFIWDSLGKICRILVKTDKNKDAVLRASPAQLDKYLPERKMFRTKVVEKAMKPAFSIRKPYVFVKTRE
jgi:hypothetical protein